MTTKQIRRAELFFLTINILFGIGIVYFISKMTMHLIRLHEYIAASIMIAAGIWFVYKWVFNNLLK